MALSLNYFVWYYSTTLKNRKKVLDKADKCDILHTVF